jgi:undecaprenyl-diphosphatase
MFANFLEIITQWITQYPLWSGIIIFTVAMIESLAIIGIVVPGIAIMFAIGALISNGTLDLVSSIMWAAAGASTGDALSFALGWHYKERIYHVPFFNQHQNLLDQGHNFFEKYGVISILIGRFIGPIRAIIPLIAGILNMPLKYYIPINIVASALWAPFYLVPGLFFGSSIIELQDYLPDWLLF